MILANGAYRSVAPQAFAETAPQFFNSYFVANQGIDLLTRYMTYGAMYRNQPNVHAAIDKIANLVARLQVKVFDVSDEKNEKIDRTSPYAKLMANPCASMDRYAFFHWLSTTYETYGEVYCIKNRQTSGQIASFIPMHPSLTQIERDDQGQLKYRFMGQPNLWMPETEVIPFRRYNPDTTMRGLSRLEPLRQTLQIEDAARRASLAWWQNMGRPSMVWSTEKRLGPRGRQNLQDAYDSMIGGADNAGGLMVLEDGLVAAAMQLNSEEMQYILTRELDREEVCSVYDINPVALQFLEKSQATAYSPIIKDVYKTSIDHRLQMFQSGFDFHVGAEFNGKREARFDVSKQLRGDIETLAPAIVQLIQTGCLMPAEGRDWLDLDEAGPEAAKLYANQALQELGMAKIDYRVMSDENPPTAPGGQPKAITAPNNSVPPSASGDLPKQLPELTDKAKQYRQEILSELGRGKTWDAVARRKLDRNPMDRKDIQLACIHMLTSEELTHA